MPILREYRCAAHGAFESFDAECPYGCSPRFVSQEFRTPPGFKSGRTTQSDKTLDSLAKDFGMTDMSNRDGESVMQRLRKKPDTRPTWGDVAHAAPGFSQRGEQAKTFSPSSYGVQGASVITQMKPILKKPQPMIVGRPKD